jgi:hypothetical protein
MGVASPQFFLVVIQDRGVIHVFLPKRSELSFGRCAQAEALLQRRTVADILKHHSRLTTSFTVA